MKKAVKVIMSAGAILILCILIFVLISSINASRESEKLEQRALSDTPGLTQTSSSSSTKNQTKVADSTENVIVSKVNGQTIHFLGGKEEDFVLTREEAVTKVSEALKSEVDFSNVEYITMSAVNTASTKYYTGYFDVGTTTRYQFDVNAMTGKVTETNHYTKEKDSELVWVLDSEDNKKVERTIQEANLEAFDSIEIEIGSRVDCEIVGGNSYAMDAHFYGSDYTLDASVDKGTLKINSTSKDTFDQKNSNSTLTITVPYEKVLDLIDVKTPKNVNNNYNGNQKKQNVEINLNLKSLKASNVKTSISNGDVAIQGCEIDKLNTTLTCGDFSTDTWTGSRADLILTCGDCELGSWEGGNASFVLTCGDLTINRWNAGELDAVLTCGSFYLDTSSGGAMNALLTCGNLEAKQLVSGSYDFTLTCGNAGFGEMEGAKVSLVSSLGDVSVDKMGNGQLEVEVMMGDVTVACNQPASMYAYKLEADFGKNKVDGVTGKKTVKKDNDTNNEIEIENHMGNNTLTFE